MIILTNEVFLLTGCALVDDIVVEGNKNNIVVALNIAHDGSSSLEIIEGVGYNHDRRIAAKEKILEVLRECQIRYNRVGINVAACCFDNGQDSNPSRDELQRLRLQSTTSVTHEIANILFAIGGLKTIRFTNRGILIRVKLEALNLAFSVHAQQPIANILTRLWDAIMSLKDKNNAYPQLRYLTSLDVIESLNLMLNLPRPPAPQQLVPHLQLLITLIANLKRAQQLLEVPINRDNAQAMRELALPSLSMKLMSQSQFWSMLVSTESSNRLLSVNMQSSLKHSSKFISKPVF